MNNHCNPDPPVSFWISTPDRWNIIGNLTGETNNIKQLYLVNIHLLQQKQT